MSDSNRAHVLPMVGVLVLALAACGDDAATDSPETDAGVGGSEDGGSGTSPGISPAPTDAGSEGGPPPPPPPQGPRCDRTKPFNAPVLVPGLQGHHPSFTPDELTVFFSRARKDIYTATRADRSAPFGPARPVPELNTAEDEDDPSITADARTIYFSRPGGIFKATRASATATFDPPVRVLQTTAKVTRWSPFVSSDGQTLLFTKSVGLENDLWWTIGGGAEAAIPSVNGAKIERNPVLSADGRTLIFGSDRDGAEQAAYEFWTARRASTTDAFAKPTKLTELGLAKGFQPAWLSADECVLYISHVGFSSPQTSMAVRP